MKTMRNRPSRTALKVARGVIWLGTDPSLAPLLPEGAAEATRSLLSAIRLHKPWHERLFRRRWHRRLVRWSERSMMPGQLVGLTLRKRYVEDEVRDALAAGARQVLVVGAGFDTLALRLAPQYSEVTFLELDHPATHGAKKRAVEAGGAVPSNLRLVAADLTRESLEDVLGACDLWSGEASSVIVAEGLLMYLAESDVIGFFETFRRATGPDSRVVFSFIRADGDGRLLMGTKPRLLQLALRLSGEPMRWGARDIDAFLAARGLRRLPPPERHDLAARYLTPLGSEAEETGIERHAVAQVDPALPAAR